MSLSLLPLLSLLLLVGYSIETEESCFQTVKASDLQRGGFVMIQERPCKIIKKTKESGNVKIVAVEIFTNTMREETFQSDEDVSVPEIKATQYMLGSVREDGFLTLLNPDGSIKEDLKPEGWMAQAIEEASRKGDVTVTVISTCDEEAVDSFKTENN